MADRRDDLKNVRALGAEFAKPALGAEQLQLSSFQRPARWLLVVSYFVFLLSGASGGPTAWVAGVAIYAPFHLLFFDLLRHHYRHDRRFILRIWSVELPADIALILACAATLDPRFALGSIVALASILTASMMFRAGYVMALSLAAGAGVIALWALNISATDAPTAAFLAVTLVAVGSFASARAGIESQVRIQLSGQARWLAFSERPPAGLAAWDRDLRITFANSHPGIEALIREANSGDLTAEVDVALHRAIQGATSTVTFQDDESVYELFCFPADDGVGTIMLDVSERMQAEAKARQAELRYQTVVESSADGIVIFVGKRVVFTNKAAVAITGYQSEEVGDWIRLVVPEQRVGLREEIARWMETGVESAQTEVTITAKDGGLRTVEVNVAAISYEGVAALMASLRDVTDQRELAEKLRRSMRMEAVGRLAGGIAHDFNNNLTVIRGYSDVCLDLLSETDALYEFVQEIGRASERAAELVAQLMNFSRHTSTTLETIDLNEVVRGTFLMLGRTLGENVECTTDLASEALLVKVDRVQFEQILFNLAVNARDAMPRGGRLTISSQAGLGEAGPTVVLTIADTGEGMSNHVKDHLFEPFFTTKGQGKGMGLGLATVYGTLTNAGATIDVDSALGEGSRFTITFPTAEPDNNMEACQRGA